MEKPGQVSAQLSLARESLARYDSTFSYLCLSVFVDPFPACATRSALTFYVEHSCDMCEKLYCARRDSTLANLRGILEQPFRFVETFSRMSTIFRLGDRCRSEYQERLFPGSLCTSRYKSPIDLSRLKIARHICSCAIPFGGIASSRNC